MTPEQIHEAEELANWEFIKDRQNIADLRDHLARFAGGTTERYARAKLEALVWADPATQGSIEALPPSWTSFRRATTQGRQRRPSAGTGARAARQAEENLRAETEAGRKLPAARTSRTAKRAEGVAIGRGRGGGERADQGIARRPKRGAAC